MDTWTKKYIIIMKSLKVSDIKSLPLKHFKSKRFSIDIENKAVKNKLSSSNKIILDYECSIFQIV